MPRVMLTARNVRTLPPRGKRVAYFDTLAPGLELRVTSAGARSWAVRFRIGRRRQARITIGPLARVSLAEARSRAREILDSAARGIDPRRATGELTVASLGEDALEALDLKPSTREGWTRLLRVEIIPQLGDLDASMLDRATIRRWGDAIVKRGSPYTAIGAFEVLSRIYSWALSRDLVRGTPFVGLELPAERRSSDRVLSTDELGAVWRALWLMDHLAAYDQRGSGRGHGWRRGLLNHGPYVDATRLLILTAARRQMVVGASRHELEDTAGAGARWIVPAQRMKSGRDHVTPLSPQALEIVRRRLAASGGDLLFPADRGAGGPMTWSSRFVADLQALASNLLGRPMARWTIHNLRHTAATHMVEDLGVSTEIVSLLLAHRPPGAPVTRIYNRAERLAERRDALTKWGAWVEGLGS